ncbi:hypothetical protein PJWF_00009 [Achromobacter phage JWF]|uniref:hypothetical protein n=1 Tax=Achromobacter phage JWF TaxID=1589748 RepID=UPI000588E5A0|nr:hypothetical protein AXJ13_gp009 [Achromobacter phage JWF]AJD82903.1 hypothetical protein PJWF_00009 [Achromobacter phage JWF]
MAKSVKVTPAIEARVRANNGGEDVDMSKVVVFETVAASTSPINKRGSIFDKGVISASTLIEMANYLNQQKGFVPLHTLHPQGDELPLGRFFYAEVLPSPDGDGSMDLVAQFYISATEEDKIAKMEQGIIDEVSVTLRTKTILCSECGWDYLGKDATIMNLFDQTCGNDHTVGHNGVHVNLNGMEAWTETSLVSKGASSNAKIAGRAKQRLSAEHYEKLAASGIHPDATFLTATIKDHPRSNSTMDKETLDRLTSLSASEATLKAQVVTLTASETTLKAQVAALTAERDQLKSGEAVTAAVAAHEATKTELAAANTAHDATKAELTAANTAKAELETKLTAATAQVEVLKANVINNPRANGDKTGVSDLSASAGNSAFKTRRN